MDWAWGRTWRQSPIRIREDDVLYDEARGGGVVNQGGQ